MEHFVEGGLPFMGLIACAKCTCQAWPCAWGLGIAGNNLFRVCLFSAQMRNSASSRRRSMVSYRSSKTKPFFLYLELDLQNEGRSKKKFQTTRGTGRPPVTESCINFQQELYEKMCCVARSPFHTGGRAETGTAPGKDSQGLPLLRTHSQL